MPENDRTRDPALDVLADLGQRLIDYAQEGYATPAVERGPTIRQVMRLMSGEAREVMSKERSDVLYELQSLGHSLKEIASPALMDYKSIASIDQHKKGTTGATYAIKRYPDHGLPNV